MTDGERTESDEPAEATGESAGSGSGESGNADDGGVVRRERFSGGPARSFMSSLAADERIFAADVAVDRAHVVMLAEQGIVDDGDAGAILGALAEIEAEGHGALPDGEDVHEAIESAVIDRVGPAGGRMHTARSRNDEVATCIRYRLRADLLSLLETLLGAREQLLETAEAHAGTVMPGYTHRQPAQPVTVGHWLASYEAALARDMDRLIDAYDRVNQSPLGAGAFAGVSFDVDRERTADLLGFDGVVENSMDAVSTRDFLVETVAGLANVATTLSGLAQDGIDFANAGTLDVDDDYASTSSIMPQKKNPDTLELVRSRAGDATAGFNGLLTVLKGLPRAYNRDLQRAGGHAWDAVDAIEPAIEVGVGAITTATWDEAALEAAAGEGFSTATGVADLLAQSGLPFRTAHEVVARAGEASDPGYEDIDAAVREILDEPLAAYLDREAVERALDPAESVAMRDSRGGPAPDAVRDQLATAADDLDAHREQVADRREHVESAAETLDEVVSEYV